MKQSTRRRPRTHDGHSRAEKIIFEALERLLQDQPLSEVTVAQIIKEAEVSRANFYHYFASKYDVLAALLDRVLDDAYGDSGPWRAPVGKERARSMDASLRETIEMWASHGSVICTALGNMSAVPDIAQAWRRTSDDFVRAVAEQIDHERHEGRAPEGPPAETIATVLLGAAERTFYVSTRGLDPRIPSPEDAVEAIAALTHEAIYRLPAERPAAPEAPSAPETGLDDEGGDTGAAILAATASLLKELSLDDLSVARILEQAGVSRATFYFYFASKDDAFLALYRLMGEQVASGFEALLDQGSAATLQSLIRQWLTFDEVGTAFFRNAVTEWPRRPDLRAAYLADHERMKTVLTKAIEADRASGETREGINASILSATLLWTIERAVAGSLSGEPHLEDSEELADFLGRLTEAVLH